MRIEKISDSQIKFILSKNDLEEFGVRLEELSTMSPGTQELFKDMMEQAMEECDFTADNTPVMIEAVPVAADGIMVLVTKIEAAEAKTAQLNLLQPGRDPRRFKKVGFLVEEEKKKTDGVLSIYSFAALDDVIHVSARLYGSFFGQSDLYKHQGKYFLVLNNEKPDTLDPILGEYGQKHIATPLSESYLIEHAESMLHEHAVDTLAEHLA